MHGHSVSAEDLTEINFGVKTRDVECVVNDVDIEMRRKMKFLAWVGSLSLVCLFIGLFLGIVILAMKATEVFEGIPPAPTKLFWSQILSAVFIGLAVTMVTYVVRGIKKLRE